MAVFAVRQHDARDKRAECRRQADERHQQCNTDDKDEASGREELQQRRIRGSPGGAIRLLRPSASYSSHLFAGFLWKLVRRADQNDCFQSVAIAGHHVK